MSKLIPLADRLNDTGLDIGSGLILSRGGIKGSVIVDAHGNRVRAALVLRNGDRLTNGHLRAEVVGLNDGKPVVQTERGWLWDAAEIVASISSWSRIEAEI